MQTQNSVCLAEDLGGVRIIVSGCLFFVGVFFSLLNILSVDAVIATN